MVAVTTFDARPWRPRVRRRRTGAWVAVVAALGMIAALAPTAAVAQDGPQVVRISGSDRFATAAEVAERFGPGVERVFLATGRAFPDALAASPVAGRQEYPILLVERDRIPTATAGALERLQPGAITVLGGTAAISSSVQQAAGQYTSGAVDRLRGPDRYATAAAIVDEYVDPGVPVAYVATGENFADALAGGPAAIVDDAPILLVGRDLVPEPTRTTLERLRPQRIVVLGGTTAVSTGVEDALGDLTDGPVDRYRGEDRFGTSAAIAREVFDGPEDTIYLTTGMDFPDALTGGVVAGMVGAPLLTVDPRCAPDVVVSEVERMGAQTAVVLGGTAAVSRDAANLVPCSEVTEPRASTIQTGLAAPWDVAFTSDDRVFLTERDSGRVLERTPGGGLREVIRFAVDDDGEGGLLGLTWSPDEWLYAMYVSQADQDQRIVRFRPDGSGLETIVSGLPHGGTTNHFAGRIAFGPDGMLYVGIGDVGDRDRAQDTGDLAGKILRYTPGGAPAPGNPFDDGHPAVYAYGLRDPQGLTWDDAGRMYISEFGQDRQDEIDRVVPGGNYGWPILEGDLEYDGGPRPDDYVAPIFTAPPEDASWSGASVLVGGDIPDWEGDLFVAALRGERLYRIDLDGDGEVGGVEELLVNEYGRLRHVTPAPDGSLWILTSNCDGRGACPGGAADRIVRLGR